MIIALPSHGHMAMSKRERIGYDLLSVIRRREVPPTEVYLATVAERTDVPKLQTELNTDVFNRQRKLYRRRDGHPRCETPGCLPVFGVEWGAVLKWTHRNYPKFYGNTKTEGRGNLEEDHIWILWKNLCMPLHFGFIPNKHKLYIKMSTLGITNLGCRYSHQIEQESFCTMPLLRCWKDAEFLHLPRVYRKINNYFLEIKNGENLWKNN